MNALESRIQVIKQKREKAITSKTSSLACRYSLEMNPPIGFEEIAKIENQYNITFPTEYRAFITTIANGGFGPNFGLLPLQDSIMYDGNLKQEKQLNSDFLKIPFIHTSIYCSDDDSYILELGEKCARGDITQTERDAVYAYLTAGTITISLEGCGYCYFLVVTGATRGQIWFNADVADGGYHPLNLSFLDWYEKWLDEYFYLKY